MAISTAVDATVVGRVLGIKTEFVNFNTGQVLNLPQRVALIGQGATASTYATTKRTVASAAEVGTLYGFGSPLHLAALQLLPENNDGLRSVPLTVYPLEDDASGVAAAGTITASGVGSTQRTVFVIVNNIRSAPIVITSGMTPAQAATAIVTAVSGIVNMPVTAAVNGGNTAQVDLTAKWEGVSGNDIEVTVEGPTDSGIVLAIVQPTAGAADPSITDALAQVGDVWETIIVNCLNTSNTAVLTELETFNEGRWNPIVNRPLTAYTGSTETTVATLAAIGDARATQRTAVIVPVPGSRNLPLEIAAAWVARVALSANNRPARDFARLTLPGINPGLDSQQFTHTQRDQLVKAGISTSIVRDGVVEISDTVTTNHPTGVPNPGYRFQKSITKLSNVIYNVALIFNTAAWDGAPLIPDDQPTTDPDAKRPKDAIGVLSTLANNLGLRAIISDVPFTLENLASQISSTNPDRLDTVFPVKVSGNVNVQSIDLNFGFFFGEQATV